MFLNHFVCANLNLGRSRTLNHFLVKLTTASSWSAGPTEDDADCLRHVQGNLADKKQPLPRTLQWDYDDWGPMVILGGRGCFS